MKSIAVLKTIKKYFVLIVLGIFTFILAINYFVNNHNINKSGVFVLGRIISKDEYKSGSSAYKYEYFFGNTRYVGKTVGVGLGHIGDLLFISLLPNDPINHKILEFTKVPYCLTLDSVPLKGWLQLPSCTQ
jgi:hypothetical protein